MYFTIGSQLENASRPHYAVYKVVHLPVLVVDHVSVSRRVDDVQPQSYTILSDNYLDAFSAYDIRDLLPAGRTM